MQRYLDQMDLILSNLFNKYAALHIKPGVLLSGGIDSSTITYLVSKYFKDYTVLSMGTNQTKDKVFVDVMSKYLLHPYDWINITKEDLLHYNVKIEQILKENNIEINLMQVSLGLGFFLIFEMVKKLGITHVFTGQGPDVLLGGYHKYKESQNVNKEIKKDLQLLEIDKKRDKAMAEHFNITLINPYLEKEFVDFSLSVPSVYKIKNGVEKYLLRAYAMSKGLPQEIVNRPKKAYQYSTGLQNMVRRVLII